MQTDIRRFGGYLSAILHPKNLKTLLFQAKKEAKTQENKKLMENHLKTE